MGTIKDCDSIRPLLSEYVDGMLDENRSWEVKMHLSTCAVCAKVADDFTATARLLSALPAAQPSANFEAMLAKRLADEVLKPKPRSPFSVAWERFMEWWRLPGMRPGFATGAAVAIIVPVVYLAAHPTSKVAVNPQATPSVAAKATSGTSDTLNELWQEHDASPSWAALGDHGTLMTASADSGQTSL